LDLNVLSLAWGFQVFRLSVGVLPVPPCRLPAGRAFSFCQPGAARWSGTDPGRAAPASPRRAPELTTISYVFGLIFLDRPLNRLYYRFNAERKEVVQNHMSIGGKSKREVAGS
jgi:hypothetical protein